MFIKLHRNYGETPADHREMWLAISEIKGWEANGGDRGGCSMFLVGTNPEITYAIQVVETTADVANLVASACDEDGHVQPVTKGRTPTTEKENERSRKKVNMSWAERVAKLEKQLTYMETLLAAGDKPSPRRVIRFMR